MSRHMKIAGSVAAVGFVTALCCAVLYLMKLPIFDEATVSWAFVVGLGGLGIGVIALVLRAIWDGSDDQSRY